LGYRPSAGRAWEDHKPSAASIAAHTEKTGESKPRRLKARLNASGAVPKKKAPALTNLQKHIHSDRHKEAMRLDAVAKLHGPLPDAVSTVSIALLSKWMS